MVIAQVNFPKYIDNKKGREVYLQTLIKTCNRIYYLYLDANNLSYRDKKRRLKNLEHNINNIYNININIFQIIKIILNNLIYSNDQKYIVLKDELKLNDIRLETLAKCIFYGTRDVRGSSFFDECFQLANSLTEVKLIGTRWGVM